MEPQVMATVVFFDVRAAGRAVLAFGPECCSPLPQSGDRCVCIQNDYFIDQYTMHGVSAIHEAGESACVVEFYDTREAFRFQQMSAQELIASQKPQTLCEPQEVCVIIKGLPSAICTDVMMDAVLDQASLGNCVLHRKMCALSGEVMLRLCDMQAANKCIEHFHGCHWSSNGTLVSVVISEPAIKQPAQGMSPPPGLSKVVSPRGTSSAASTCASDLASEPESDVVAEFS